MRRPADLTAYGALVVAAVVWGGSIVGQKVALGSFSAVEVSVLRGLGALAILIPLWWGEEGGSVRISARDGGDVGALGLGELGNYLVLLVCLRLNRAAEGGGLIGASPAFIVFID